MELGMGMEGVPAEVLRHLLSFMDTASLINTTSMVSVTWRQLSIDLLHQHASRYWSSLLHFSAVPLPAGKLFTTNLFINLFINFFFNPFINSPGNCFLLCIYALRKIFYKLFLLS